MGVLGTSTLSGGLLRVQPILGDCEKAVLSSHSRGKYSYMAEGPATDVFPKLGCYHTWQGRQPSNMGTQNLCRHQQLEEAAAS